MPNPQAVISGQILTSSLTVDPLGDRKQAPSSPASQCVSADVSPPTCPQGTPLPVGKVASARVSRVGRELDQLRSDPPPGVEASPISEHNLFHLQAQILGPEGTPYSEGVFHLDIEIPERYPFEPPKARFKTPIYHPNIDDQGRICLDSLKMQPNGSWTPSLNIPTILTTIRLLMAHPNAEDGLMPEVTAQYRRDPQGFEREARNHTRLHAMMPAKVAASPCDVEGGKTPFVKEGVEDMRVVDPRALEDDDAATLGSLASLRVSEDAHEGGADHCWDSDVSVCGEEESGEDSDYYDEDEEAVEESDYTTSAEDSRPARKRQRRRR